MLRCRVHKFPPAIFQTFRGVCKPLGNQSCKASVISSFVAIDNKEGFRRVIFKAKFFGCGLFYR
jgi:hypothetical protein